MDAVFVLFSVFKIYLCSAVFDVIIVHRDSHLRLLLETLEMKHIQNVFVKTEVKMSREAR